MALSLDFAFEGFRVIRQKPKLILYWGALLIVMNVLMMTVVLLTMGSTLADLQSFSHTQSTDPSASLAVVGQMFQKILPMEAMILPFGLLFGAVLNCAVYRAVLGYKNDSFGYLRLGPDELRQVGISILFFLMFIVVYIGLIIGAVIVGGLLAVVLGLVSKNLAVLGAIVGGLFAFCGLVWYCVRMSLFGVIALDQKKIELFASFGVTKGNFWQLLIGYIVMAIMALVVGLLAMIVIGVIVLLIGMATGAHTAFLGNMSNPTSLSVFFSPAMIVNTLLSNGVLMPLIMAMTIGTPAAAYKALIGTSRGAAQVF